MFEPTILDSIAYTLGQFAPGVKPTEIRFHPDTWREILAEFQLDWLISEAKVDPTAIRPETFMGLAVGAMLPGPSGVRYIIYAQHEEGRPKWGR